MLSQVIISFLIGVALGFAIGIITARSTWLSQTAISFLRVGRWLPFIIFWSLPIWPPRSNYEYEPVVWAWFTSIVAVGLSTSYTYLTLGRIPGLTATQKRSFVLDDAMLQATLISAFSQVWVGDYGWLMMSLQSGKAAVGYTAISLLLIFLFIAHRLLRINVDETLRVRTTVLVQELSNNLRTAWGCLGLTAMCIAVWHLLSAAGLASVISSPAEVLENAYHLLILHVPAEPIGTTLWWHMAVSAVESAVGLLLGGLIAVVAYRLLFAFPNFQSNLFSILYFAQSVSILVSLLFINWFGLVGSYQVVIQVTLLTIFPIVVTLWQLRDRDWACRTSLAVDEALPFITVGILFGGIWGAEAGIGFFMSVSRAYFRTPQAVLAALCVTGFLIALSWILRAIGRRFCIENKV